MQQVAAPAQSQQPLPQMIAQGQAQAQGKPNQEWVDDFVNKKYFDMPPWREKHAAESKQIGRAVTVMTPNGPQTLLLDKTGQPMQSYPVPPEYGSITQKDPYGAESQFFYPKHQPPAGGIMTQPPAQAMQKAPSEAVEKDLRDLEGSITELGSMIDFAKDPKNKDAFGAVAAGKHQVYQSEGAMAGAGRIGLEMMPKAIGGGAPRTEVSTFLSNKQAFINRLRNKMFGAALSDREYSEFVKEAVAATTPEQFTAVATGVHRRLNDQYQRLNRDVQQPYGMRQKPSLDLGKTWIENGVKYRINPQTGKKQMWRD
jgi:hypothetical protein